MESATTQEGRMSSIVDELEARIKQLSEDERAELLGRITAEWGRAWLEEIERRRNSPTIPAEQVHAEMRELLEQKRRARAIG